MCADLSSKLNGMADFCGADSSGKPWRAIFSDLSPGAMLGVQSESQGLAMPSFTDSKALEHANIRHSLSPWHYLPCRSLPSSWRSPS
jgi:hypothetical protein